MRGLGTSALLMQSETVSNGSQARHGGHWDLRTLAHVTGLGSSSWITRNNGNGLTNDTRTHKIEPLSPNDICIGGKRTISVVGRHALVGHGVGSY